MNLAKLVQNQTLATLLQALSPTTGLPAGGTVEARLVALAKDGTATAQIGGTTISLVLAGPQARQAALQPGAMLLLELLAPERPDAPLRATLLDIRPAAAPAQAGASATVQPQSPPQAAPQPAGPEVSAIPARSVALPPGTTPAQAVATLPVLPQASAGAGLPASAQTQPALAPAVTLGMAPARAAQASVAGLAQIQTAPVATAAAVSAAPSPRGIAGPMLGSAIANQDGIAPLLANLRALSGHLAAGAMPAKVLRQASQVLAQALPVENRPVTPQVLRQAVAQSGLFMEAHQAAGQPAAPRADLKAGLVALRNELEPLLARLGPAPTARSSDAPLASPASPARPAPPRRDGPLVPQPIAEPTLAASEAPQRIAETLLRQTEAALDRIALSQFASLPLDAQKGDQGPVQRWITEIPLAFHNGTAMLPLKVEREPARREAGAAEAPLWRVRFALDVEPMGPLQGVVTLQGRRVGVTLWAEREEISRLLRGAAPGLEAALLDASFEQGAIDIHTGRPPVMQPTAGQFLDRLS